MYDVCGLICLLKVQLIVHRTGEVYVQNVHFSGALYSFGGTSLSEAVPPESGMKNIDLKTQPLTCVI